LYNFKRQEVNNKAIQIQNLSKRYLIGKKKDGSLRGTLGSIFSKKKKVEEFWALKDFNLDIEHGEVLGVIGKNGAGKSTLLKLLSQITFPTNGRIEINGRVASLLEVGTGFHPELTGRENIFLNGTILGMSRKEVASKFDEIVNFSGIEKFIDTPVKRYSSGMYVRLAFAVAAHLEPEILIIDEVLAVGDMEFQKKCLGKMKDVAGQGRTVIFVSHNMAAVKSLCTSCVTMSKGQLVYKGNVEEAIKHYLNTGGADSIYIPDAVKTDLDVYFKRIEIQDKKGENTSNFTCDDEINISFNLGINAEDNPYNLFVIIKDQHGSPVFSAEQKIHNEEMTLTINKMFLVRGNYMIHTFVHIPKVMQIDIAEDVCHFNLTDSTSPFAIHGNYNYGSVFGNYSWK